MRSTLIRTTLSALILTALMSAPEVNAGPPGQPAADATLYEVLENMTMSNDGVVRTALAALQGTARLGSPLCPAALGAMLPPGAGCTVTAIGRDRFDLSTLTGTLWGDFAVVINVDNPVDAAEFVVMTGTFSGEMTADGVLPLIAITNGKFTSDSSNQVAEFSGVFRLPFTVSNRGLFERPRRNVPAFYLTNEGRKERVKNEEYALGWPTVRVEVTFSE